VECCPRKLHSLATAWASHIVAVLTHFRLSPYPRPPSGRQCMQNLANLAAETSANTCTEAAIRSPGRLVLDRPGRRRSRPEPAGGSVHFFAGKCKRPFEIRSAIFVNSRKMIAHAI